MNIVIKRSKNYDSLVASICGVTFKQLDNCKGKWMTMTKLVLCKLASESPRAEPYSTKTWKGDDAYFLLFATQHDGQESLKNQDRLILVF